MCIEAGYPGIELLSLVITASSQNLRAQRQLYADLPNFKRPFFVYIHLQ
jgi:hypothetical protein